MGELLALLAAACFGLTHFLNGLAARRAPGMTVSLYAQLGGTGITVVAALLGPHESISAIAWGVLSGVGTGTGVALLYRAISRGALSVVVPVSDVGAVAIPVLAGFAVVGGGAGGDGGVGVGVAVAAGRVGSAGPRG